MKTIDKLKEKLDAVAVRGTGTSYLDPATKEHFKALCEIIDELTDQRRSYNFGKII